MKIVSKDSREAEKEALQKQKEVIEDQKRDKYLESLRTNRNFQRYVVEGILRKSINKVTDISSLPNASTDDLSKLGNLVVQAKATRSVLENILGRLL